MGEGLAVLAGSLNTVRTMAVRDIYETCFDEDVQTEPSANQCPECDGHVTTNVKETVCEDCGLVIEEQRLDHGLEWRAYDADERERTGAALTTARHDRGLSTEIGRGTDANGNELSAQKRRWLARMRREQTRGRWQSKAEQNLAHGLGEVQRLASVLDLSDSLRDQACQLFQLLKEHLVWGRQQSLQADEPIHPRRHTERARVVLRTGRRTRRRRRSTWAQSKTLSGSRPR
jgi:transcription initiation factor TFIIB